jgi:hypothetical protein
MTASAPGKSLETRINFLPVDFFSSPSPAVVSPNAETG